MGNEKTWIIIALALIIIGAGAFALVMSSLGWDFSKLSSATYEAATHEIEGEFSKISIDTDTADIIFAPSENGEMKIECYENVKVKHSVRVENDTLLIKARDERKWYERLEIGGNSTKITVYLPSGEYSSAVIKESTGDIEIPNDFVFGSLDISVSTASVKCYASAKGDMKISASTGDIYLEGISASNMELYVSTGDIYAKSCACVGEIKLGFSTGDIKLIDTSSGKITANGSTGDIYLKNVIADTKLTLELSTGDVDLDGCDSKEIKITTSTGYVKGTVLTRKVFDAKASTGYVSVPKSELSADGICEIKTSTGDIIITIKE